MFRSQLYVPANNEKMIRKTETIKADSFIFDLEDAVPQQEKEKARELLSSILPQLNIKESVICTRINSLSTKEVIKDLDFVINSNVDCLVIPKTESDISFLYKMTGKKLIPIIETARGLVKIEDIARSEGIIGITWGAADLADSLKANVKSIEGSEYIRLKLVSIARTYGISPIDKVFFDVKDLEGFRKECELAKSFGFDGKQAIHPNQVSIANEVFSPSKEEIEWAKKVVEEYEKSSSAGRGAITVDGKLVDAVHYRIAKRILSSL
ncbi:CoA ester lyase [Sulfurisphaera javensis]|uniref:CoA ester lyase n=1 Tax=Sulfurisphaera javensis TaxID=2049879 RepID=A0AAT9GN48_9CREN